MRSRDRARVCTFAIVLASAGELCPPGAGRTPITSYTREGQALAWPFEIPSER